MKTIDEIKMTHLGMRPRYQNGNFRTSVGKETLGLVTVADICAVDL